MGDYKIAKYFALDANRYHILNNTSNYIFRITFRNPKCISNSFCWSIRRIKTTLGRKIILLSLICLVVITGIYYIKKGSADGRLLIWRCAMPMLQQNWLTGYGTGGFEAHYMDYQADYFENIQQILIAY